MRSAGLAFLVLLTLAGPGVAAPKPVPPSPYLPIIYRYADAMLKHGRDTHGPQKTGLFLSALDRMTLAPLGDRPAADPQQDQNLLRVLYTLSELSGKPIYRDAADAQLKWLISHASASPSPLPPWETGMSWNVVTDTAIVANETDRKRAWMLWDRCFDLAPDTSKRLALELSQARGGARTSPRRLGFSIRAWAVAYQHTKDDALLKPIEAALGRLDTIQNTDAPSPEWLSAAIDCGGAATRVPEPLGTRLRTFAARRDQAFCGLPHDLAGKGGFVCRAPERSLSSPWPDGRDGYTTARVAMMCVSRYENTANVAYRDLIHAAADAYRKSPPPEDADTWPMTFGHAISLQLAAWRSTSNEEYLNAARKLADQAVNRFWADGPLPRASSESAHYETITGADTLALALVELHLSILHITAVRCPPNTIDR